MKRSLISQILHEWRSNIWLAVEIMVVGGVICYLTFNLITLLRGVLSPLGFDPENVYSLSLKVLPSTDTEANGTEGGDGRSNVDDIRTFLARLRENKHVEAVAISDNATPFYLSYNGASLMIEGMPDSIRYSGNVRVASPDIVRVLRPESLTGQTPEELEASLRNGEILLSPYGYNSERCPEPEIEGGIKNLVGRIVMFDSINQYRVGGIVRLIKRVRYERPSGGMILFPVMEDRLNPILYGCDVILRVKPGEGREFVEELMSDPGACRVGNVVAHNIESLHARQSLTERNEDIEVRINIAMTAFFLLMVFLGLLGSFWYRVQQRREEIALRKVSGATNRDIFRRLMSESSLILLAGMLPGAVLFILFCRYFITESGADMQWPEIGVSIAFTYVVMQCIVVVGVFFPARSAMSVQPAVALKDE